MQSAGYNESRLAGAIDQLHDYLAIVGLVALLLGGIGVASGVHAFVDAEDRPGRDPALPRRDELAGARDLHDAGGGDGSRRRGGGRRARTSAFSS